MIPTIAEASRLFEARKLSPVELVQSCLARADAHDDVLHAFILRTDETARAAAKASEARMMAGARIGPLDGIPIAHKDIYETAGIRTTAHSRLLSDHVPARDATTVRKLAEAGTIMLGKLATHEFAWGGPSFDLPWPPARNPWNPAHVTGGSSSGTGAAVAVGMVLGGTGSDTGGSIRNPAGLCGLAGIKPTYGRCSRAGILPLAYTLDHAGPLAWTVEDCALLLQAMAGYDPADPACADRPLPDMTATLGDGVRGLRVGVVRHFHERDTNVSEATAQGLAQSIDTLRRLGASITDVTLSPLADYNACGYVIMSTEAFAVHQHWMQTSREQYGELLRDRLALGALISGADYVQAQRRRRELLAEMTAAMADIDILLCACQVGEALPIEQAPKWSGVETAGFTMPFNVTGFPAMSIRSGFGAGGLPICVQLAARPFEEPTLLRAAHALEREWSWHERRPPMVTV
jgi:aspartyl-tRNA(Asn)/glutamyl-tRNA(Gln) amidotransferase subunit A